MKKYHAPTESFFRLPNKIFDVGLTPIQFMIYAYLVCCAGSKGYCWPSQATISRKTGIGKTSVQEHLKILEQRQLISKSRRRVDGSWGKNNVYILLSLDNPEVYRELKPAEELPFDMHDELPL